MDGNEKKERGPLGHAGLARVRECPEGKKERENDAESSQ